MVFLFSVFCSAVLSSVWSATVSVTIKPSDMYTVDTPCISAFFFSSSQAALQSSCCFQKLMSEFPKERKCSGTEDPAGTGTMPGSLFLCHLILSRAFRDRISWVTEAQSSEEMCPQSHT